MTPPAAPPPSSRRRWRVGTPVVAVGVGVLLAISAANSEGTDLRPGRYTDLASVVRGERQETERLTGRAADLTAEVEDLSTGLGDRAVNRYRAEVDRLSDPAGLTERTGPAVSVTLTDAPLEAVERGEAAGVDPNRQVVHQQDIQAVVNAMWRAGASAVTVQGQRLVATTGIKCEGNSVTLHGVPYSPPYVIVGVGDPTAMLTDLDADDDLGLYRADALDPLIGVGWSVGVVESYTAPAYAGLLDLGYARPM